jgi:hypothetical protein
MTLIDHCASRTSGVGATYLQLLSSVAHGQLHGLSRFLMRAPTPAKPGKVIVQMNAFLCTSSTDFNTAAEGIEILRSTDGGRTVQLAGRKAPITGDGGVIAVPPHRSKVITFATSVGSPSWLGHSANGGRTLTQVASFSDGFSWNSLSSVSRTTGWIVPGGPALGGVTQLLQTSDAGRSWHEVGF